MSDTTTREEAREAIRSALLGWKADGVARPLIPVYADRDGDGIPDVYQEHGRAVEQTPPRETVDEASERRRQPFTDS